MSGTKRFYDHNCLIVFFKDQQSVNKNFEEWYDFMMRIFEHFQIKPRIFADDRGKRKFFKQGIPHLIKKKFAGLTRLTLSFLEMEGRKEVNCSCFTKRTKPYFLLSYSDYFGQLNVQWVKSLLNEMLEKNDVQYAYHARTSWDTDSHSFAMGSCDYFDSIEAMYECNNWNFFYNDSLNAGLLKDVYLINLLSPVFLERMLSLENTTLQTWIESNPQNGKLEGTLRGSYFWMVEPENIPRIKEILRLNEDLPKNYFYLQNLKASKEFHEQKVLKFIEDKRAFWESKK